MDDAFRVETNNEETKVLFELSVLVVSVELQMRNPVDIDDAFILDVLKDDTFLLNVLVVLAVSVLTLIILTLIIYQVL